MRFPPYLFGFPMTTALWYAIVLILTLVALWILQKIFRTIVKDFASGLIIFVLIIVFVFVVVNIVSGSGQIGSGFTDFFNSVFNP
jgi:glucan phosphoethanolaminetransferase (alkaline phosphatase superfamily)